MELTLDATPASPHRARCFLAGLLDEWNVTDEQLTKSEQGSFLLPRDTALLLVSELVTNAVVHAGTCVDLVVAYPQRGCESVPSEDVQGLRVEVRDHSATRPTILHVAPDAETGRGLALVEALADRWGVHSTQSGKNVWFEIGGESTELGSSNSYATRGYARASS